MPEAIPYLNPLLFETNQYVRINAVQALRNFIEIAYKERKPFDKSSLPFLLLALHDSDQQKTVPFSAFVSLQRMELTQKFSFSSYDAFEKSPLTETQKLFNWWRDELSGKNKRELMPGETLVVKTVPANISRLPRDKAVAVLNPLLWEMSLQTRRAALMHLQKLADRSSIPYLLLACEDPDFDVAYGAYQLLGTLLPEVGAPVIRKTFESERAKALEPFYAWWQDELLDKHSPEGVKRFQQEQEMRQRVEEMRRKATAVTTKQTPITKPSLSKSPLTSSTR